MADVTTAELSNVELFNFNRNLKDAFGAYPDLDAAAKEKLLAYLRDGTDPTCLLEIKVALAKAEVPSFSIDHGNLRLSRTDFGRKLLKFFHQHPTPCGYYFRLAEWLMLHSQISPLTVQGDQRLPEWFNVLARVYKVMRGYSYGIEQNLRIISMACDLTEEQMAGLVSVLVDAESSDYTAVGKLLIEAADAHELFEQFVWDLVDQTDDVLQVRVPWNDLEEASIAFLETIKPEREKLWGLLGRITVTKSRLSIYPLSLLSTGSSKGDSVLCPHFDQELLESRNQSLLEKLRSKYGRAHKVQTEIVGPDDDAPWSTNLQTMPQAVRDLLVGLEQLLHGALEAGAMRMNKLVVEQLGQAQHLAASLGMEVLEQSLGQVIRPQAEPGDESPSAPAHNSSHLAASILDAAYTVRLAGQAAANLCLQTIP